LSVVVDEMNEMGRRRLRTPNQVRNRDAHWGGVGSDRAGNCPIESTVKVCRICSASRDNDVGPEGEVG
jgi:hypothetical protein